MWLNYLETMIQGKVLRQAEKECDINLKTAFHWRHRFLQLPALLKANETFFSYSEKGNKQLTCKARKRGKIRKSKGALKMTGSQF